MFVRVVLGVGLTALGFFVGRELGRGERARERLDREPGPPDPGVAGADPETGADGEGQP